MKPITFKVLSVVLLLTACTPATQIASVVAVMDLTATRSPIPTNTATSIPTETPAPSITPLPTIPSFTPTFDTSTIITVTSAPKAECPTINPDVKPEDFLPEKLEYPTANLTDNILEFLNKGGNGQALIARLKQIYPYGGDYRGGYNFDDVTGDQNPEFLYVELNYSGRLLTFSCKNGKYELFATLPEEGDFLEYTMQGTDLNSDGIPEIIVTGTSGASFPQSTIYIYEWNGRAFSNIGQARISALREMQFRDTNGNGTKEIILTGDNPGCLSCSNFIPQRERTSTYGWNGKEFVEISNEFALPKYRFQAVQDADRAVLSGGYDSAIHVYKEVISNGNLEWWSPERMLYEQDASYRWIPGITPVAMPDEELTEYPRLAAYAYYRIMLIHLVQNRQADANPVFNTLQEKFGSDQYGQPYVEMATEFWNTYQSTHNMYDGCAAAIQYATEHPDILTPLGSDYHGWQSRIYVPADVCPFR